MRRVTTATLVVAAMAATSSPAANSAGAPNGFQVASIVLYQPDDVLRERLGDSAEDLAAYVKRLVSVCATALPGGQGAATLDVVVAVKPGKRARVWFVAGSATVPGAETLAALRGKLEAVTPLEVQKGPVAFAIIGTLDGAKPRSGQDAEVSAVPIP